MQIGHLWRADMRRFSGPEGSTGLARAVQVVRQSSLLLHRSLRLKHPPQGLAMPPSALRCPPMLPSDLIENQV